MIVRANRYSIQRPLEYRLRESGGPIEGTGKTVNISRKGLLFEAEKELQIGTKIEVMVRMGTTPLDGSYISLHIQGFTIRSDNGRIAVSIKKYRLRSADRKASMSSAKLRLA
jgi:hypothetical protein